jgi:hypothetical protein
MYNWHQSRHKALQKLGRELFLSFHIHVEELIQPAWRLGLAYIPYPTSQHLWETQWNVDPISATTNNLDGQ